MCSHYGAPEKARLHNAFADAPEAEYPTDMWPTYLGPFVRLRSSDARDEGQNEFEVSIGQFGLVPSWAKDRKFGRRCYNARSETVDTKPSYRTAWKKAQHCIIPASFIFEPDYRQGKPRPAKISRRDGGLMAIAGIWEGWGTPTGDTLYSFSMLTINAEDHDVMRNYHAPEDEKRMVVILPNGAIKDWLHAPADQSMDFIRQYPADRLIAETL